MMSGDLRSLLRYTHGGHATYLCCISHSMRIGLASASYGPPAQCWQGWGGVKGRVQSRGLQGNRRVNYTALHVIQCTHCEKSGSAQGGVAVRMMQPQHRHGCAAV